MKNLLVRTVTDNLKTLLREFYKNDNIEVYEKYINVLNEYATTHNDRVDLSDKKVLNASQEFVHELCERLWFSEKPTCDIVYKMHKVCVTMTRLYKYAGLPVEFSYELKKPLVIF